MIKEELLHYIWRTKNYDHSNLTTSDNQKLEIMSFGFQNDSDGPDFLEACVKIDEIIWNGAVEIHVNASDWNLHGHQTDAKYLKTILHVVYHNDRDISYSNNQKIPCLELKRRIPHRLINIYKALDNECWIPCQNLLSKASEMATLSAKEGALHHRMTRRWSEVEEINQETEKNWEEVSYRIILRAFGLTLNGSAFLELAKRVPYKLIQKNRDNQLTIEAMLYGAAGLLNDSYQEQYPQALLKEYKFQKEKYQLEDQPPIPFNYKRVRPQNFPAIKISQFANLVTRQDLLSNIVTADLAEIKSLFKLRASDYWDSHYTFEKSSKKTKKTMGSERVKVIIINAVVPILYFLGKIRDDDQLLMKANYLLEALPSEKNSIITKWNLLNVSSENAFDSQALLELKKNYCDAKACMKCPIGHSIMMNN